MWARFKVWFKNQSTGRQYAVVLGIGFVLLVLAGAVSGGDKKDGGSSSSSSGDSVTATQASKPPSSQASDPSSSELVTQAHQAVKQDSYAQALTLVAGLSTVKRTRLRRMIGRRLAFRARSAVRHGNRAKARRLLRQARRYPPVAEVARARTVLVAATASAALQRQQRAAAAAQRKAEREAAAQARKADREAKKLAEQQQQAASCEPGYDPCVPPYPPDLDCGDLSGPYSVTGSDPHGLDADGDGVGCESG